MMNRPASWIRTRAAVRSLGLAVGISNRSVPSAVAPVSSDGASRAAAVLEDSGATATRRSSTSSDGGLGRDRAAAGVHDACAHDETSALRGTVRRRARRRREDCDLELPGRRAA